MLNLCLFLSLFSTKKTFQLLHKQCTKIALKKAFFWFWFLFCFFCQTGVILGTDRVSFKGAMSQFHECPHASKIPNNKLLRI